ncbi:hypothetical protein D4740_03580 [Actinomyces sp. 2119]|uniref:Lipoprotein n=1 Tax=Actinomyces lilanjuaniae TaxID=2321394 RepID=A0ABM6Z5L9_9ACTO|nr:MULTISPECIES: hypothetical protein [Actinomyces]AYD90523.1 hypothetical protein D5R93_11890 [Actinomyces lilanjuaniae]RJF44021.1 hypothetical protein D4740_03580 [Actinomyces sp. 2119]
MKTRFLVLTAVLLLPLTACASTAEDSAGADPSVPGASAEVSSSEGAAADVALEDLVSLTQPEGTQDNSQEGYSIIFVDPDDDLAGSGVIDLGAGEPSEDQAVSEIAAATDLGESDVTSSGAVDVDGEDAQVYTGTTQTDGQHVAVRAAMATREGRSVVVLVQRTGTSADAAASAAEKDFLTFVSGISWKV